MVRIFFALIALCFAQAALAQSFPQPPDVGAYSAVTPQYKTDGTANTPIDATVTPMPVSELTNIPIPSTTNRIISNGPHDGSGPPFCLTTLDGGSCFEAKFRTVIDFGYMLPDDPIRNYGQPGQSHLHCFFGGNGNAYSTYKSLRQQALHSTAAGTDANGTLYWYPCPVVMDPYGNGNNYAIEADFITVYYEGTPAEMQLATHIPIGLRYVFGFDMDSASTSTQFAWLQTVLDAANLAEGSTRYTLTDTSGHYKNQASFNCTGATPLTVYVIKTSAGADPHGGTCGSGQVYYIKITGPSCYDGTNLWSPGGYKHLIPQVWDNDHNEWVCPINYYQLPELSLEIVFQQTGWTDRQRWDLSSDIAYRAAKGLTTSQLPPGTTFHTDWLDGWDDNIRDKWEDACLGVEHGTPHECDGSQTDNDEYLKGGTSGEAGAGGRNPQVNFGGGVHTLETDGGWMLIPDAWSGSLTNHKVH